MGTAQRFVPLLMLVVALPISAFANEPSTWKGPSRDFEIRDGRVFGPWWQGGGPAVVYYTGPHSHRSKAFIDVGKATAKKLGRPYLEIHKKHLQPSAEDKNGILAYPDGTTRVRLFMMPGGNSAKALFHLYDVRNPGRSIMPVKERKKFKEGRKVPVQAFDTGMNFVGVCAGFYFASSGYDIPRTLSCGWELWPGKCKGLGPEAKRPFPDVLVTEEHQQHPLYKATNAGILKHMYFNGGPGGIQPNIPDTEYFGVYVGGSMKPLIGRDFLIAYRPRENGQSGRVVAATGHPEVAHQQFLQAMVDYALDHDYEVPRNRIAPGKTVTGVIGDGQMLYYCVRTPAGKKLTIELGGLSEDCNLYLRHKLPPTFKHADQKSASMGKSNEQVQVASTQEGEYFIGIYGAHRVLNGSSFTLQADLD